MWCWMVGFEEDKWVAISGAMADGGCWVTWCLLLWALVLFWNFFDLGLFEDVGWLIGWVDICLILLCDAGSNWLDLGLIIVVRFFFWMLCTFFPKWDYVWFWKMSTSLVSFFFFLMFLKYIVMYNLWILIWAWERERERERERGRERCLCSGKRREKMKKMKNVNELESCLGES